jgi:hypothetical protein
MLRRLPRISPTGDSAMVQEPKLGRALANFASGLTVSTGEGDDLRVPGCILSFRHGSLCL